MKNTELANLASGAPGVDPYLTWALLTDFRGYSEGSHHVAVELDGDGTNQPWETEGPAAPMFSPHRVAKTNQGSVFTGLLENGVLQNLLERARDRKDIRIEFNQPRVNDGALFGDGKPSFAEKFAFNDRVVAIIDHGCPFAHKQFLKRNGQQMESRVRHLWDQEPSLTVKRIDNQDGTYAYVSGKPREEYWYGQESFGYGSELTTKEMNKLIAACITSPAEVDEEAVYQAARYDTLESRFSHGAAVMDIAAGHINPLLEDFGAAPDAASAADIIFVQLPRDTVADTSGGSMTKYVLDGLKYILDLTIGAKQVAINLSYGSMAGPHNGSSLLERAMDAMILDARNATPPRDVQLVLPAGNHHLSRGHGAQSVSKTTSPATFHWQIQADTRTDNFLEIWYPKAASGIAVKLTSPSGKFGGTCLINGHVNMVERGKTIAAIVHKDVHPLGDGTVALLAIGPTFAHHEIAAEHGVWTVEVSSTQDGDIALNAWVERNDALVRTWQGTQSELVLPNGDDIRKTTGNSLAHGRVPYVVGAYTKATSEMSPYSASGPNLNGNQWPSGVAVGDESPLLPGILVAGSRSGTLVRASGTSVAAPQVTRAIVVAKALGKAFPPTPAKPPPAATHTSADRVGAFWLQYP